MLNDNSEPVDGTPKPPARVSSPRKDFFWLDLNQFADLRDIKEFARLGDDHFRRHQEERIAAAPEKVRNVEALFAPPHEMHVHWAVIILLCIRLEENVKAVSALLHQKDDLRKTIHDFGNASLIKKFRLFLAESAGWAAPDLPKNSTWEDVSGVYAIRNCLIHNQASFADFASTNANRANEIMSFAARYGTPTIVETWLDIDIETSLVCVKAIQGFFDELFATLKKRRDYLAGELR
jgi:hypothetical protein